MEILFYIFSSLAVVSCLSVISSKNPVHSVFFLILVFCLSSLVLLLLTIDFLSIIFIVVYVGAIAVLFLFVVMMLNIRLAHISESVVRYVPLASMIGIIFLSEIYYLISGNLGSSSLEVSKDWVSFLDNYTGILLVSNLIYTHYIHVFLASGLVLLLAMIGTISLTLHHSLNVRRQQVFNQVGRKVNSSILFYNYKG